jgi:hypothetical protein
MRLQDFISNPMAALGNGIEMLTYAVYAALSIPPPALPSGPI